MSDDRLPALRLTIHARRRIQEREIELAWVAAAIAMPDWTKPDAVPGTTHSFRATPECGGRILKVVHRLDGADILVVTLHLDRRAKQ